MKVFKAMLTTSIIIIVFAACKKNDDGVHSSPTRLKTVTTSSAVSAFSYDSQWRLIKLITSYSSSPSPIVATTEYTYTDTSIVTQSTSSISTTPQISQFKLYRTTGMVSSAQSSTTNAQVIYFYTVNKQIESNISYTSQNIQGVTLSYFYTSENLDSIKAYQPGAATFTEYYDEYITDKLNTIGNENMGLAPFGLGSKNLIKKERTAPYSNNNNRPVTTYAYEYDNQNRVTKQIKTTNAVNDTTSFTYY